MLSRRLVLLGGVLSSAALASCARWRTPTVPLRTLATEPICGTRADTLLVMLPGRDSPPEEFRREGLVQAVAQSGLAADVLLVDAHMGYYRDRSIVERLQDDVLAPARAQGYRRIWLAGISLGGLGALLAAQMGGEVDGLLLIAPYLGEQPLLREIRAAGGLMHWQGAGDSAADPARPLWEWLQQAARVADRPGIPVLLGYGLDDRFADAHALLAAALSPDRVFTAEGGHDWPAWRTVWRRMLAAVPMERGGCLALRPPSSTDGG